MGDIVPLTFITLKAGRGSQANPSYWTSQGMSEVGERFIRALAQGGD